MDDKIDNDVAESAPRWVTQAVLVAKHKLALSHGGLTISQGRFFNQNGYNGRRAAAPDAVAISQSRARPPRSGTVEDRETTAALQRGTHDNMASWSHSDRQLGGATGQLMVPANYHTPEILKLNHADKIASITPAKLRPPVSAGAGSATKTAHNGMHAPIERNELTPLSQTSEDDTPRRVSVRMGPLQPAPTSRPAFGAAEHASSVLRVAPARAEAPRNIPPTLGVAPGWPYGPTNASAGAGPKPAQNLSAATIGRASFSAAPSQQKPSAPFGVGQDRPTNSARRGEREMPGLGTFGTTVSSSPDPTPTLASSQGGDSSTSSASKSGPTEGDVFLDGTLVGRWMARTLTQAAARQPSSGSAFDPTRNRLPAGTMIGV